MLCCVVLCCVVSCRVVLCCVALRCVALRCVVLCCVVLCCVALRCVVLCCVVLCCVVLCCVVLCCVVLCCVVLCCVVLCCVVQEQISLLPCSAGPVKRINKKGTKDGKKNSSIEHKWGCIQTCVLVDFTNQYVQVSQCFTVCARAGWHWFSSVLNIFSTSAFDWSVHFKQLPYVHAILTTLHGRSWHVFPPSNNI